MQKQVIELKREKSVIQQAIIECSHKIADLEEAVGNWTNKFFSIIRK